MIVQFEKRLYVPAVAAYACACNRPLVTEIKQRRVDLGYCYSFYFLATITLHLLSAFCGMVRTKSQSSLLGLILFLSNKLSIKTEL